MGAMWFKHMVTHWDRLRFTATNTAVAQRYWKSQPGEFAMHFAQCAPVRSNTRRAGYPRQCGQKFSRALSRYTRRRPMAPRLSRRGAWTRPAGRRRSSRPRRGGRIAKWSRVSRPPARLRSRVSTPTRQSATPGSTTRVDPFRTSVGIAKSVLKHAERITRNST